MKTVRMLALLVISFITLVDTLSRDFTIVIGFTEGRDVRLYFSNTSDVTSK